MSDGLAALAYERAEALRLPAGIILDALRVVESCVGPDWLLEQARKLQQPGRSITDAHGLYQCLQSTTDQSLITICELAEYLTFFKDDPSVNDVLKDLRSPKFAATFFEIANAYRWANSGASDVRLQPSLDSGGVADFTAALHHHQFVVEASIFPNDEFARPRYRYARLIAETAEAVIDRRFPVAIKVEVRAYQPGDFEGLLRARVKQVCNDLCRSIEAHPQHRASLSDETFSIEAEPITVDTEDILEDEGSVEVARRIGSSKDWTVAFRFSSRSVPPGVAVRKAGGNDVEAVRVFALLPAEDDDRYERIAKKLKKETRQLRGVRLPRVVLLEVAGLTSDALQLEVAALRSSVIKVMQRTPELACVWLMTRGWSTYRRFQYRALYIPNAESVFQLPLSFMNAFIAREWRYDFLAKEEIEMSEDDEAEARADYARRTAAV